MLSGGSRTHALRLASSPPAAREDPSTSSDDGGGREYFLGTGLSDPETSRLSDAKKTVSDREASWLSENPIKIRSRARSLENGAVERGWTLTSEERARSAQQWFTESGNQSLDFAKDGDVAARSYPSGVSEKPSPRSPRASQRLSLFTNRVAWFCFLALLGVGASILSFLVDEACRMIALTKMQILVPGYEFATWVAFEIALVIAARLCVISAPLAEGSGVPEMKTELRGSRLQRYFTPRVLLAKMLGLSLARGGGLPLGKEGLCVHMSACVAQGMPRTPVFGSTVSDACNVRRTVLSVSVAVGVGTTLGSPIGAVLFTLETMPDIVWHNISYWSCLVATVTGAFSYRLLISQLTGTPGQLSPIIQTDMGHFDRKLTEDPGRASALLIFYVILGCLCGVIGAAFVMFHELVARMFSAFRLWGGQSGEWVNVRDPFMTSCMRQSVKEPEPDEASPQNSSALLTGLLGAPLKPSCRDQGSESFREPLIEKDECSDDGHTYVFDGPYVSSKMSFEARGMILCIVVAAVNASWTFMIPLLRIPSQSDLMGKLISVDPLHVNFLQDVRLVLLMCVVVKFFTTALSTCLPLPTGCIAPVYVIGLLIGRLFGHVVAPLCGVGEHDEALVSCFALVGCTAFAAGVCRSFSIVVAVFELVALPTALVPLCASALAAILTANALHVPSIFDAMFQRKHLPAMQMLASHHRELLPVGLVAVKNPVSLPLEPTPEEVRFALKSRDQFFPVMHVAIKTSRSSGRGASTRTRLPSFPEGEQLTDADARATVTSDPYNSSSFLIGAVSRRALWRLYLTHLDSMSLKHSRAVDSCEDSFGDTTTRRCVLDLEECQDGLVRGLITPLVVKQSMSVQDVFFLLDFHRIPCAFVCSGGRITGIVSSEDLLDLKPSGNTLSAS